MGFLKRHSCLLVLLMGLFSCTTSGKKEPVSFEPIQETAKPWVYWYWMQGAYSKEGITADLEAMKSAGIAGAYLMSIKGPTDPPLINPPILQLSEEWWNMVHWALAEAGRLGLKIAFHAADGFAVAGGPWITPEMSMQKVVWADTIVNDGVTTSLKLPVPEHYGDYYQDIATFAIPVKERFKTSLKVQPKITTSLPNFNASFLSEGTKTENQLRLYEKGWVQYEFKKPFSCRSIQIETLGNNYQAHRLRVEASDDGTTFKSLGRLEAARHGWQDTDVFYTHSIPPITAKYFRFVYDPEGTEPGAEDLDAAKWKQALKVAKIILSNEPLIDNYQGKSGAVWRIGPQTTSEQIEDKDCIDKSKMINISRFVDAEGVLHWKAPKGNWRIIRFGHTSTGHENATGGAGKGLEVDKFDPEAIRFQLDNWFGEMLRTAGPELASKVVEILHLDSWECGSQNWSPVFQEEFKKRRGYDVVDYLPVMAGIPMESVETSEKILFDIRKTISELIADNFYGTVAEEAEKAGVKFSSENVAPTMVSDALLHFKYVDYPGGEFWLKSPTHDKPNDMLDAISGGHIYGKDIIQAEAFTALRMDWDEHPGNLKTLADRNYALGINRFFYHVFVHNPWIDRKPGMTLDGVGTYFQRDQTWWEPGKAFIDYCTRVQYQLQKGRPVVDLAVFTGEEIPSRAVLPDRLVPFIPNVFGEKRVTSEKVRLENYGQPTAKMPKEVTYSKNTTDLSQWVNALNGYKYDSFNVDVLLNRAEVKEGKIHFEGGIEYQALLFPGSRKMAPDQMMSLAVAEKILALVKDGATVLIAEKPTTVPGLVSPSEKRKWKKLIDELWKDSERPKRKLGKGTVVQLPYLGENFTVLGFAPDVSLENSERQAIAWTHRKTENSEIYFLSNQKEGQAEHLVSFRTQGRIPYKYDPVTDTEIALKEWKITNGRTVVPLQFHKNESFFIIFKEATEKDKSETGKNWTVYKTRYTFDEDWQLQFDTNFHGPSQAVKIDKLFDWSSSKEDNIKYYSGTVTYSKTFDWKEDPTENIWLDLGVVHNIAEIQLNGKNCGILWTFPNKMDISKALKKGRNTLKIKVTNTWANRLIGDRKLPEKERLTWTTAPSRLEGNNLLPAGLLGPVTIEQGFGN
jgi:hypothetical protein